MYKRDSKMCTNCNIIYVYKFAERDHAKREI